jgi:uncharacterized circularly permuted ATP-grasp superfamily protein
LLLVEGGDLRVTGDQVSLKTLHGLMPIDLDRTLRGWCGGDPLELDSSGFAGPVGLLQAIRKQSDLVVNALGSALAENRGLSAYLPKLARRSSARTCSSRTGPGGGWGTGESSPRAGPSRSYGHPSGP